MTSSCRFSRNISFVAPVAIRAASFCILSSSCFFISSTVVPDDIRVFQKRSNESSVYNLKRFPVKLEFKSSHYINLSPYFVCYVFYVFTLLVQALTSVQALVLT